jgi:hypothetical protein
MNDDNPGIVGHVIGWFAHPFRTEGSALNWVLFVGLLIVAAWMWNIVLMSISD